MKVRFGSSLCCKEKGLPGIRQKTCWQFEYAGMKRVIPAIYRFSKGIVFDIITFLDETKVREFFKKCEAQETELTPVQRELAEEEYPYRYVSLKEIWINQKCARKYSSSSGVNIPWQPDAQLSQIRKAYRSILKDTACFTCQRYCVPYPETDSKLTGIKRFLRLERINSIRFSTHPVHSFFPLGIRFEMSMQDPQREVKFRHPVTGKNYKLFFQMAEPLEIPLSAAGNHPLRVWQAMYEIDPALPDGERLRFDSTTRQTMNPPEGLFLPSSASSIGIIGGADGPTSIFLSGGNEDGGKPLGKHGLPLHSCLSVPAFGNEETVGFIIEGIEIRKYDSVEYSFGEAD